MRLHEVITVQVKQTGAEQLSVLESKLLIDLDAIQGLSPAYVPSDIRGADGMPQATEACRMFIPGGAFTIKEKYEVMKKLWAGEGEHAIVS